jgi:hypothetical protein
MKGLSGRGDADPGVRTGTRPVPEPGLSSVRPRDQVDDREAESRAATSPGVVGAAEAVERAREEVRWDAGALVEDMQLDPPVPGVSGEDDRTGPVRESVLDQVAQSLREPWLVALDQQARGGVDPQRPPGCLRLVAGGDLLEQILHLERLAPERQPALVEAREEKEVVALHKASFVFWLGAAAIHVLVYLPRLPPLLHRSR